MGVLYDNIRGRLVFLKESRATSNFWDEYWEKAHVEASFAHPPKQRFLIWTTQKYLRRGAKVLEGGCGMGGTVFALDRAGFETFGVDFAEKTVTLIQQNWPHLQIFHGDVRSLPFDDEFFDGYWSLGVIEHFYDGYDEILQEMFRVVKPGGYAFITFPAMNALRRKKALQGEYPLFEDNEDALKRFYQFALEPAQVVSALEKQGFHLVKRTQQYSLVGLQKERGWFKPCAAFLSKCPGGIWVKLNMLCDVLLGNHLGHTCLLVVQKQRHA